LSQFRRKQISLTGHQITDDNLEEVAAFCGGEVLEGNRKAINVPTLLGLRKAYLGDYVYMTDHDGRVHVRDPLLFEQEFEPKPDYGVVVVQAPLSEPWYKRWFKRDDRQWEQY